MAHKNKRFKYIAIYDEATPETAIPTAIARSVRMTTEGSFVNSRPSIQRRNIAGPSHTHKRNKKGQYTGTVSVPVSLANSKTSDVLPAIDEHITAAGMDSNILSTIITSGPVSASPGDIISETGTSPTATGIVAFATDRFIIYMPVLGTFSVSDQVWVNSVNSTETISTYFEEGVTHYTLNSRASAQRQLFFYNDLNVDCMRNAAATLKINSDNSADLISAMIEYQGRLDEGLSGEVFSDPDTSYPDAEPVQFSGNVFTVERLDDDDMITPIVQKFSVDTGLTLQLVPNAGVPGGVEDAALSDRGDVSLSVDIMELPKTTWDPKLDKQGQDMRISMNNANRVIFIALGQVDDVQPSELNGFNTQQIKFDLNSETGIDNEFRMIFVSEEIALALDSIT